MNGSISPLIKIQPCTSSKSRGLDTCKYCRCTSSSTIDMAGVYKCSRQKESTDSANPRTCDKPNVRNGDAKQ